MYKIFKLYPKLWVVSGHFLGALLLLDDYAQILHNAFPP